MRLPFLIPLLYLLLSSCSSKIEVQVSSSEIDSILSQDNETPVFKDSLASNYAKEYDSYVKDYLTALRNKDTKKIKELQEKSEELTEKAKLVSEKIKTEAELSRYQEWMTHQQDKIQLLNINKK